MKKNKEKVKAVPARKQLRSPSYDFLLKKHKVLGRFPVEGYYRSKVALAYYRKRPDYPILKQAIKERKAYLRVIKFVNKLAGLNIKNEWISFARWIFVDLLRGKKRKAFGIYQFVALPGEGKTMSMVAHMERFRKECEENDQPYRIACNFTYKYADVYIKHWIDMVQCAKWCYEHNYRCLIAFDEIHVTFDSADWKDFPAEVLAMLSFNRKYGLEFCCTSQIYERIPKKIRDIANYTVICKNIGHFDRMFRDYYFDKSDYEAEFTGKRKNCKFIRQFIADDEFYSLYNTLEQVDNMVKNAKEEKLNREKAFDILFGSQGSDPDFVPAPLPSDQGDAPAVKPKTSGRSKRKK